MTGGIAERARQEADEYRGGALRWVATAFVIGLIFVLRLTRLIAGSFTALSGADFVQLAYAMAQQAAEG